MNQSIKGTCLCKAVTLKVASIKSSMGACHCGMCQKWSGGPMLCVDGGTDVKIEGESTVTFYNSSAWAERAFCKTCGTHLFYRLNKSQYFVPVGLLEGTKDLTFDHQIFIDKKHPAYSFANPTKNMTEAEFMAQFADPKGAN